MCDVFRGWARHIAVKNHHRIFVPVCDIPYVCPDDWVLPATLYGLQSKLVKNATGRSQITVEYYTQCLAGVFMKTNCTKKWSDSGFLNFQTTALLPVPNGCEVVSHPVTAWMNGSKWHKSPGDVCVCLMFQHLVGFKLTLRLGWRKISWCPSLTW